MCRIVSYFGNKNILLDELLVKPENSLVNQSHRVRNNGRGLHADGFGIAWYNFDLDDKPGIFKSIQPAWNDYNIHHLASKISSNCMLTHVRASTVGDVIQSNCHPFAFNTYSMVHNGTIRNFDKYKIKLIREIDEDLFLNIKGNTDSEFFFFLVMTYFRKNSDLLLSLQQAIKWVIKNQNKGDFSRLNIVITNGKELLATCFSSAQESLPLKYFTNDSGNYFICSEPLDSNPEKWTNIPNGYYLYLNKDSKLPKFERIFD